MNQDFALPVLASRLIPHQFPMALVDVLISCDGSGSGVTEATLPDRGPWIRADGALEPAAFVELIAQSYAAVKGYLERRQGKHIRRGFLVGVPRVAILQTARAGEKLTVTVNNLGGIGPFSIAGAEVRRDTLLLATGSVKVWVADDE